MFGRNSACRFDEINLIAILLLHINYEHSINKSYIYEEKKKTSMLRVGFEPTPFRTRTLIWRLRPTRPSQPWLPPR